MYDYKDFLDFVNSSASTRHKLDIMSKLSTGEKNTMELLGEGDSWQWLACIDWLVKNGYIREYKGHTTVRNLYKYVIVGRGRS